MGGGGGGCEHKRISECVCACVCVCYGEEGAEGWTGWWLLMKCRFREKIESQVVDELEGGGGGGGENHKLISKTESAISQPEGQR